MIQATLNDFLDAQGCAPHNKCTHFTGPAAPLSSRRPLLTPLGMWMLMSACHYPARPRTHAVPALTCMGQTVSTLVTVADAIL